MVKKLNNFDEWIDYFRYWQESIGLPAGELRNFPFDAKFGDQDVPHIEFGHYKGERKWPTVMHIPDQATPSSPRSSNSAPCCSTRPPTTTSWPCSAS